MKVYTYWQDLHDGQARPTMLIDLWARSWQLRNWEPVVLGIEEAKASPLYEEMVAAAKRLPTVNDPAYEMANYVRYCALEAVGGGWLLDYDCINYSLFTDCVMHKMKEWPVISFGPGACWMPQDYVRQYIQQITSWPADKFELINGRPHLSDMVLLMKLVPCCYADLTVVAAYKDFHWRTAQVVHYSNDMAGDYVRSKCALVTMERPV